MKEIKRLFIKAIKQPHLLLVYLLFYIDDIFKLNDKFYLKIMYFIYFRKRLDLKNPKTFCEKLQWIKLYDRKEIYHTMVDKYEMKKFVSDRIGSEYVIPVLGVWDRFEDIDFNTLPDKFILKCTHDNGSYTICKDKKTFDTSVIPPRIARGMKKNQFKYSREWPYKGLKRRIIAEPLLKDSQSDYLTDYKFFCFMGQPEYLWIITDRGSKEGINETCFDMQGNRAPIVQKGYLPDNKPVDLPKNLTKMIEFARILSRDTLHLRVDFYNVAGQIYVGELTFFDGGGYYPFEPEEYNMIMGDWIKIPKS
ncbi:MAG: glycosyl transferase [Bacteroidales bacterium]|jgi:hypothetical protein|nr:glycosyl transferase [Bacteroidales bacterium]